MTSSLDAIRDAVLRGAVLPDGNVVDVWLAGGRIARIEPSQNVSPGLGDIDLAGCLLLPAPAEPHAHFDKVLTAELLSNDAGDLDGAMRSWYDYRQCVDEGELLDRARAAANMFVRNGATAVRTHVDVGSETGCRILEPLLALRTELRAVLDLQVVAMVDVPVTGSDGAANLGELEEALGLGADAVGGAPYRDPEPLACQRLGGKGSATAAADDGCSFEPLLFTKYATGAGVDDVVPAGHPASVEVDIAHQFGAAAPPITSFAAQVSFDDGTTWTDAPGTRLADGRYRLDYSQLVLNATSGFASLRVRAADAGGSAIDQTITRAYPLAVTAPAPPSSPGTPGTPPQQRACTAAAAPYLQCLAIVNAAAGVTSTPTGLGPDDIRSAYNVPARGRGRTVAIVDAYDDPNAESDLAAYRAQYGLPPCTSANGCFRKVNQHGASAPLPSPDPGWGLEISLGLDAVSATCPACHILLVEADSSDIGDLLTGVLAADPARRRHLEQLRQPR